MEKELEKRTHHLAMQLRLDADDLADVPGDVVPIPISFIQSRMREAALALETMIGVRAVTEGNNSIRRLRQIIFTTLVGALNYRANISAQTDAILAKVLDGQIKDPGSETTFDMYRDVEVGDLLTLSHPSFSLLTDHSVLNPESVSGFIQEGWTLLKVVRPARRVLFSVESVAEVATR